MSTQVLSPFPLFTSIIGAPLNLGYVYIGDENQDPETNPQQAYWDEALTIPATQPLRTNGGYIVNAGDAAAVYVGGAFSIRVRSNNGGSPGTQVFYRASVTSIDIDLASTTDPSGASLIGNLGGGTVQDSIAVKGTATAVAGSVAAVRYKWEDSTRTAEEEGGIWSDKVYFDHVFNKEFTAANSPVNGVDNSPATPLMAMAFNNGSQAAVVGMMTDAIANVSNSSTFGGNLIARSDVSLTNVKLVGLEIDVEFGAGTTSLNSGGLILNVFNINSNAPAILVSGVGGTWGTAFNILSGISTTGTGFGISQATPMGVAIDLSAGSYNTMAILMGTGISHGVEWGSGGGGTSPITYGDSSGNWITQMGAGDLFAIKEKTGFNTVLVVDGSGNLNALASYQVNGTKVVGPRDTGWAAQTASASKADLGASPTVGQIASWAAAVDAALKNHGIFGV